MHTSYVCMYAHMYGTTDTIFNVYITDFAEFKAQYHTILQLMPDSYAVTVGKLGDYINFDQICVILSSSSPAIANKLILDCLIERVRCKEDLLDLCNQLEKITTTNEWQVVVNRIRSG